MRSILGERAKIVLFFSKIITAMKNILIFIFVTIGSSIGFSQNLNGNWAFNELRKYSDREYTVISEYQRLPHSFEVDTDFGSLSSYKTFTEYDFFHMNCVRYFQCTDFLLDLLYEIYLITPIFT